MVWDTESDETVFDSDHFFANTVTRTAKRYPADTQMDTPAAPDSYEEMMTENIKMTEGLPLVILQSCSSLKEPLAQHLFDLGGVGLIGSVTGIHSASGSAYVKSTCNALLYQGQTLGEAIRYARNYFLCLVR